MTSVDVAIVGGGVMGLATAWRLAGSGASVLLIERFEVGHDRGSSHGATRIFRYAYDDPLYVRMAQQSLPMWNELDPGLVTITGGVDVGDPARLEAVADALESCGAPAVWVDAERLGWFRGTGPAVFSPDTGVIAAADAVRALRARIDAEVWEHTAVLSINADADGVALETDRGAVTARRAVIAAGAWTGPMLAETGIDIPLRVTREQVFYFDKRGDADIPVLIDWAPIARYAVPTPGGAKGVKVGEHHAANETIAEDRDFEPDPAGRGRVIAFVRESFPSLDPDPVAFETCLYTNTPDEHFVIDAAGSLVVVSPCSGHGFKFAPLIGEAAAALVTDRAPPIDLSPFSLVRFGRRG